MQTFDPVTLEVYWQRLISIAEEQAKTLTRTAFSSQAGEMEDISSGIFDARGRMIAQGVTGTVGVLTALVRGVPEFLKQFPPDQLGPGDILVSNDPWLLAGHLNDIAIVVPVFHHDRLIAFTATMSHATDIGGKTWTSDYGEVYEEGICIPPMKLYDKGKPQELLRLLEKKVVELEIVETASDSTIGRVLKKHSQTPSQAAVGDSPAGRRQLRRGDGGRCQDTSFD